MGLRLELVGFRYGGISVFEPLTLSIEAGESLALVGGSGSGKSSLLTLLAGLHPRPLGGDWQGHLSLDGREYEGWSQAQRVNRLGYLGSDPALFLTSFCPTVLDELGWSLLRLGQEAERVQERVAKTLEYFELESLAQRNPLTLSGGQQQVVCLASLWARGVEYLLLDEPTAMLDPVAKAKVTEVLGRLHSECQTAVVWATSQLEQVSWVDRFFYLDASGRGHSHERGWKPTAGDCLPTQATRICRWDGRCQDFHWEVPSPEHFQGRLELRRPSRSSETSLSVEALSFTPPGWEQRLFQSLSFEVSRGERVALVGPNGAGKSCLAKLLRGVYTPDSLKSLTVGGEGIETLSLSARTPYLSYTFQDPSSLFVEGSVRHELLYSAELLGLEHQHALERVDEALGLFELSEHADRNPRELPAALQALLGLALGWFAEAQVQILDEPSARLDGPTHAVLARVLDAWRDSGTTVLVISHDIDWLLRTCDRFLVLEEGELIADMGAEELLRDWPSSLGSLLTERLYSRAATPDSQD